MQRSSVGVGGLARVLHVADGGERGGEGRQWHKKVSFHACNQCRRLAAAAGGQSIVFARKESS